MTRLSSVLFRIAEAASLDTKSQDGDAAPTALDAASRVWTRAARLALCGVGDQRVRLGDMLVAGGWEGQTIGRLRRLENWIEEADPATWPETGRPHGYFVGIVHSFRYDETNERYEVAIPGWANPIYVEARPRVFAAPGSRGRRSPYLAIVSFALPEPGAEKALGLSCSLQPCDEETWMPIDSNQERRTLSILVDAQKHRKGRPATT